MRLKIDNVKLVNSKCCMGCPCSFFNQYTAEFCCGLYGEEGLKEEKFGKQDIAVRLDKCIKENGG
jgi:hypothetical protein